MHLFIIHNKVIIKRRGKNIFFENKNAKRIFTKTKTTIWFIYK